MEPTEKNRKIYLQILADLNAKHANFYTQKELSEHLRVSVRKMSDFQKGKIVDFWLLCDYGELISESIVFNLETYFYR